MRPETLRSPRVRTAEGQLPLPLDLDRAPAPPALPVALTSIPPRQVWQELPPTMRQDIRRAWQRILQEVVRDAGGN